MKRKIHGARSGQRRPQFLFNCWREVAARLRAAEHLALFLDFDGTLVRLRRHPGRVWLEETARRLLGRLARSPRVTLCVISGRQRDDVRRRVGVPGIQYVGLHGGDVGEIPPSLHPGRHLLEKARARIDKSLSSTRGVRLEDKGGGLTVHLRGLPRPEAGRVAQAVRQAVAKFHPRLRLLPGKKVLEVFPREVPGKGRAVQRLMRELPRATQVIYVGDDTTDEAAFRVVRQGVSVRVGRHRNTKARYLLYNPEQVLEFLKKLEGEIL